MKSFGMVWMDFGVSALPRGSAEIRGKCPRGNRKFRLHLGGILPTEVKEWRTLPKPQRKSL
jgi:hypothetical protein